MSVSITSQQREAIIQGLSDAPDGVLEALAGRVGVPLRAVLDCLPEENARRIDAEHFEKLWQDMTSWGEIVFIVHTEDGVFECKGTIPQGQEGRGYFNIHGDSPIGGHIRKDRCEAIYFIDRPFFGKRSCSVQFVNRDGGVMFKVFVGRDENRALKPEQLEKFEALRQSF
ncbi:heme utilization cystosolic carrier protein HutX [Microvirga sp. W0021]|uniref:Heme utilization cystosolic carrier protein HutX n=1 Tax=Hohaiivirga grylli TaxID=3133970 RepID=A0ABV0BKI1_9HYPH